MIFQYKMPEFLFSLEFFFLNKKSVLCLNYLKLDSENQSLFEIDLWQILIQISHYHE